ncbi:type II toxin-antitoxin system VapB family antitoxin [Actinoplanes sp. L3-i22]|uniref:type II toxin-antitoxin system VapB family antitoxin n=1 Tax=Actinoplanes sp. L3-i22 TaxID=2836373 RepID=UPI001C85FD20|nr:type II toxin-antitoxin system VapB family antitoxin [Actinoplanes sp. L3-i22]
MAVNIETVQLDLDDEIVIEAAKILGTKNAADTVNAALREVVAMHRRIEAFDRLAKMGAEGDFDVLLDKENYRR